LRGKQVAVLTVAHATLSAALWLWTAGVAGLGFKDRAAWTLWDNVQVSVVPPIALAITAPGRFLLFDGWAGLVAAWLGNSLLWSIGLVGIYRWLRFTGRDA
jgi:hypothetical protein